MPDSLTSLKYIRFDIAITAAEGDCYEIRIEFDDPDDPQDQPPTVAREPVGGLQALDPANQPLDAGRDLSKWLFNNPDVRDIFTLARGRTGPDKKLRLRIRLPEKEDRLQRIQWEKLLGPGGDTALATDPHIAFSRYVRPGDLSIIGEPPRLEELRGLVLIATPPLDERVWGTVSIEQEQKNVTSALGPLGLQLDFLATGSGERPSLAGLVKKLDEAYHFVYLICHGRIYQGEPHLLLEDENGQGKLEPTGELLDKIWQLGEKSPRLVVLTACESGGASERLAASNPALAAIGPRLVQAGVPAVVAMQGQVRMGTAAEFMKEFFREICDHGCVDRAMTPARSAVLAKKFDDWWMPALFMNLKEGLLWKGSFGRESALLPALLPAGSEVFVGRSGLLNDMKQKILAAKEQGAQEGRSRPGTRFIVALHRAPGIGKTELAKQLANDPELQRAFGRRVLWVDLGKKPFIDVGLRLWLQNLGVPVEEISQLKTERELANVLKGKIGFTQMLLIVDDVWDYQDASWFLDVGPRCIYVLTTRLREVLDSVRNNNPKSSVEEVVDELDEAESLELVRQIAPSVVNLYPDKVRRLVRTMGGHPFGLVLVSNYLSTAARSEQQLELDLALRRLKQVLNPTGKPAHKTGDSQPQDPTLTVLHAAIELSKERLQSEEASRVLHQVSIFLPKLNTFSLEEAAYVCGIEGEDGEDEYEDAMLDFYEILLQIRNVGLLEQVPDSRSFMIHRVVADYGQSQLGPQELCDLHCRAAEYYQQAFRSYEESKTGDHTAYVRMYNYEQADWQRLKSSWLYHLSYVEPAVANRMFARLFLDAFWWWGCYREFPFCRHLIEEWEDARTADEDRVTLRLLRSFQKAYPQGYQKTGKGDWAAVERALLKLRQVAGIEYDLSGLSQDLKHLRAVTDLFLAESHRYRDLSDPQADAYYDEALQIFQDGAGEDDDDAWNVPWTLWHQGDLYLERGQDDLAVPKARESRTLAQAAADNHTQWDNEIIANDYRVEADAAWQRSDRAGAFRLYARAVLFAYAFQASPKPADFYTVDFYGEMTVRTVQRLEQLWDTGEREAALQACRDLHDFWGPYWESIGLSVGTAEAQAAWAGGGWEALLKSLEPGDLIGPAVEAENCLDESQRAARTRYLFPPRPCAAEIKAAEQVVDEDHWPRYFCRVRQVFEVMFSKMEQEGE